jgi:hypothetical protein
VLYCGSTGCNTTTRRSAGRQIEAAVVEQQRGARAAMSEMRWRMEDEQMAAVDELTLKFEALSGRGRVVALHCCRSTSHRIH